MKRFSVPVAIGLLICLLLVAVWLIRVGMSRHHEGEDEAAVRLQEILTIGGTSGVIPAPGNQIRTLMESHYGLGLLSKLDEAEDALAFDPFTGSFLCIWEDPQGRQTLFFDSGMSSGGLTSGLPTQVRIETVGIDDNEVILDFIASSATEDENEVREFFQLDPGKPYRVTIPVAELVETDFLAIWRTATPREQQEPDEPPTGR